MKPVRDPLTRRPARLIAEHDQAAIEAARWAAAQHQPTEPLQLVLALEEQRRQKRRTRTANKARKAVVTPSVHDSVTDSLGGDAA
jgi:hypothetical protein